MVIPVAETGDYFVLRLDRDPAARLAALIYADEVKRTNPALTDDLFAKIKMYDPSLMPRQHWLVDYSADTVLGKAQIDERFGPDEKTGSDREHHLWWLVALEERVLALVHDVQEGRDPLDHHPVSCLTDIGALSINWLRFIDRLRRRRDFHHLYEAGAANTPGTSSAPAGGDTAV